MRTTTRLILMGMLATGCSERPFVLTLRATDGTQAGPHVRAHWTLYGDFENAVDSLAKPLAEGSHGVDAFPAKLEIQVPRYPHDRIREGMDPDDAMYWFDVDVDLDGDGRICGGDMRMDWEDFNDMFMHDKLPRRRTIPLAQIPPDVGCGQ